MWSVLPLVVEGLPEMRNAESRIDARTVDEPGSDSRWNSGLVV
jgi:hypothetical protein